MCKIFGFGLSSFLGALCLVAMMVGDGGDVKLLFVALIISLIISLVYRKNKGGDMSKEEVMRRTKQNQREKKIEREYGIIDFSEKK